MRRLFPPLLAALALAVAPPWAEAREVEATVTHITFHISHPAKEYDVRLLPGGATINLQFDPNDMAKTTVDCRIQVEYFNSENPRRDSHMMDTLEGLVFPIIDWKVEGLSGVSGPWKPGTIEARAKGPLTVHGTTQELETPVTVDVAENGLIDVKARFQVKLEDFGIERPTLVFVPIANVVPIQVQIVFPVGTELFAPPPAAAQEAAAEGAEGAEAAASPATPTTEGAEAEGDEAPGASDGETGRAK